MNRDNFFLISVKPNKPLTKSLSIGHFQTRNRFMYRSKCKCLILHPIPVLFTEAYCSFILAFLNHPLATTSVLSIGLFFLSAFTLISRSVLLLCKAEVSGNEITIPVDASALCALRSYRSGYCAHLRPSYNTHFIRTVLLFLQLF